MTQTKTISLTYLSFSKSFILIPNAIFLKTHICQNTFRIYILLKCIPVRVRVELPNATLISFLDIERKKERKNIGDVHQGFRTVLQFSRSSSNIK
jgi:hypothetical protein